MPLRYLTIDRILSKDVLIQNIKSFTKTLENKIALQSELSAKESLKIKEFEGDFVKDTVFHLVSVSTPIEEFTPIKFNLIFDYENLEQTERCDLKVLHILYLRNNYLFQLPMGHHCEILVECKNHPPQLFKNLPIDSYGSIQLGFCNEEDWPKLKAQLLKSRLK